MDSVGSAFQSAHDLARARELAGRLVATLEDVVSQASDLAHVLDHVLDLDIAIARARARDLAHNLGIAHNLDIVRALARHLARDIVRHVDLAVDRDLARDLAVDRDRDIVRALNRGLEECRLVARRLVVELEKMTLSTEAQSPGSENSAAGGRQPWRFAVRMTAWLVRVLPATDQARYREEYQSELFDIAQGEHPRRAQLAYVIRSLVGVLPLRRALRMPAPQPRRQGW